MSAYIIQNSAVGNFSPKTEGKKTKATRSLFSDVFSLPVHFEFFAIFSYCLHIAKYVCLQRLKQEWQKSPAGTRQTFCQINLVWRNRKKNSQKTTFTYRSSS
jgi:hypothetical protein